MAQPSFRITLTAVLMIALSLRFGYALILYLTLGDNVLTGAGFVLIARRKTS